MCRGVGIVDGGDRLIAKMSMSLFMLYIACCFSLYEAPQPPPVGAMLRFDSHGNLIQIVPGTSPAGFPTVERAGWRREWLCAEPVPEVNESLNYTKKAVINATTRGVNGAPTTRPVRGTTINIRSNITTGQREWCPRHPANR